MVEGGGKHPAFCEFRSLTCSMAEDGRRDQLDEIYVVQEAKLFARLKLRIPHNNSLIENIEEWTPGKVGSHSDYRNLFLRNEEYFAQCILGEGKSLTSVDEPSPFNASTPLSSFYGGVLRYRDLAAMLPDLSQFKVTSEGGEDLRFEALYSTPSQSEVIVPEDWKITWVFADDQRCKRIEGDCLTSQDLSFTLTNSFGPNGEPQESQTEYESVVKEVYIRSLKQDPRPDPKIFRLSSYGFPEPESVSPPGPNMLWLFGVVGAVLVVASIVKSKRR